MGEIPNFVTAFAFTRDEVDILLFIPFCITLTWNIVFLILKKQLLKSLPVSVERAV